MTLREDIRRYVEGWEAVEEIEAEERRNASFELRWKQFCAAFLLGRSLGFIDPDPSEQEVYEIWRRLKERLCPLNPAD